MPRVHTAYIELQSSKDLSTYLRRRAWHWVIHKNYALTADYTIRLLNRHPRDPLGLILGEIAGKRTGQPTFVEKCNQAKRRLCFIKRVDNVLSLLHPKENPMPEEVAALITEEAQETHVASGSFFPVHMERRDEQITVRESEELTETQVVVQRCCRRVQQEALAELLELEGSVYGRGLYATQPIPSACPILADTPIFVQRFNEAHCSYCLVPLVPNEGENSGLVVCPHCQGKEETYCSKACQEAAWMQYHACCCASTNPEFSSWQQAMLETLYSETKGLKSGAVECNKALTLDTGSGTRASVACLAIAKLCAMGTMQQTHPLALPGVRALRGDADYEPSTALSEIGALAVALSSALRQPLLYMEEVLSIFALLQTNEFFLPNSGGIALYSVLSFLNHSCDPNCAVVGSGAMKRQLVALRGIRKGEQLFIDYNSYLTTKLSFEDRKALCAQRHFECFCAKCIRRV